MDLLFTHLALTRKWRLHFHRFMVDIQAKRHVLAQNGTFGKEFSAKKKENKSDSIQLLAQNIGQDISVLCLDELDIRDMADAMIIGRLFKALVQEKIFLIVTSNVAPEGLYAGGVNRTRFVSFVEWLKGSMYILPLRSSKDFRLDKEQGLLPSYFLSTKGERNEGKHKLEAQFQNFTGFPLAHALPYEISILGRIIRVPRAAQGIAYFSFQELCGGVYGAADYLALAQNFHTLFLESIPCLYEQDAHPMKRLVLLIDTLYDCQVALYASAEALPEHLCQSAYSAHQQEFKRIVSRLIEIQSKTYKELCLNHPAREGRA